MNFRPELAERVMDGRKWVTRRLISRNPRSPYHPTRIGQIIGREIAVCPGRGKPAIGRAKVVSVGRHVLDPAMLTYEQAQAEGFTSAGAFLDAWKEIHHDLNPVAVWKIELRPVGMP